MPRAFLIKSRAAGPVAKKEDIREENDLSRGNAQPIYISTDFHQESPSVVSVTNSSSRISSPNDVPKESYTVPHHVQKFTEERKPTKSPSELPNYTSNNLEKTHKARKIVKRSYVVNEEDEQSHKKIRKGQPKKTVVYYYTDEKLTEKNDSLKPTVCKDDSTYEHYTHEKRHYANEPSRYESHELTSQSQHNSTGKLYAEHHSKQVKTLAYRDNRESFERGKTLSGQRHSNNEHSDRSTSTEKTRIVEYHPMEANRTNSYREEVNQRPVVTQHPSQGYYSVPHSSPHIASSYAPTSPVSTSTTPAQIAQPPRATAQPMPSPDSVKSSEQEPKVVYVPVYPVSQGPNGVIYEPIPNATPILAKDTVHVQKVQPPPQPPQSQQHLPEQPRMAVQSPPHRQEVVVTSPPAQVEQKPQYRVYEPQVPMTAAPAPQTYQPHPPPQSHVIVQQPPTTYAVQPQYAVRPAHQYQQAPYHPAQRYQPATAPPPPPPQPVIYRPAPPPQTYQEQPPRHYYPRQPYQERVVVQNTRPPPPPPVVQRQPIYRPDHPQPRPPPLPSQPQHAEKPSLPSPSYPQESASRLLTPRYTPDGVKHEHKFVYAPPPADFMNSPVYRVPSNDENVPLYQPDKHHKTGSRKRKSSYPTHAVLQSKTEQHTNLPSPANSTSRTPSPKETDLRCNERLVKSPHQSSTLNKSSLVMTPPVSPNDTPDGAESVTVVVRDQGIQASPRGDETLEHTCFRKTTSHVRSNSYQSESSEEEYDVKSDSDEHKDGSDMYTEDGTVVVHIPGSDNNNNNTSTTTSKKRSKKSNARFTCKFCNKGFQWHSHLESHERTHTGEKPFRCPECGRAFCRADGLQCHMLVHNKKRPYKCPHCGKGFNDKIVLEKHIYSHTGIKPFKCEYCGRAFSDSLSIEKHLLVHTGTKPYKCPYCVRSFNDSQMLVRHIRSHTGEKAFKCKHCPMAFSKQSALIIHTRVHTGEKPFKCPHCVKSFSISGNLQRHILIHTGQRPYKCSKCPKAFNNPSHLSRHISKLHAPQVKAEQPKYEQVNTQNTTAHQQPNFEHYSQLKNEQPKYEHYNAQNNTVNEQSKYEHYTQGNEVYYKPQTIVM